MPLLKHAPRRYASVKKNGMLIEFIPSLFAGSYDVVLDGKVVGRINDERQSINMPPRRGSEFELLLRYSANTRDYEESRHASLALAKKAAVGIALTGELDGISAKALKIATRYKPARRRPSAKKNAARNRR